MAGRVVLDARKLGDGGIGTYLENLIDGLLLLIEAGQIALDLSLLVSPEQLNPRTNSSALHRWQSLVQIVPEPARKYSANEYLLLGKRQQELLSKTGIFHSPHYTLPFFLRCPSVVTIHDTIHLSHPETFYHRPLAKQLIGSALNRASAVITVSEASKRTLHALEPRAQISVIPNALPVGFYRRAESETASFRHAKELNRDYCVFIGSDRPHKGFATLIEAWRKWSDPPRLVAVGTRFSDECKQEVAELGLLPYIRFIPELSREELCLLLNGACALLMPSREEGFGLPALEAMACGTAVVCTPVPALREVCGDVAWYSKGWAAANFLEVLKQAVVESEVRTEKVRAGLRRAEQFSLEQTARATAEVYAQYMPELLISDASGAGQSAASGGA